MTHTYAVIAALCCLLLPVRGWQGSDAQATRATAMPQIMFSMGTEANGARATPLVRQAPVRMLTSWYNGPNDLSWMATWQGTEVPRDYAAGYALQLIVYAADATTSTIQTPYGPACGRAYPLSPGFLSDMTRLAQIFNGAGPLYVSMFAEFQTYACTNNQWAGSENYWRALKDQYRKALAIFHQYAPNSHVSLCWGGWQARWDNPAAGGGRSLFPYFADVMSISDYQSFQAMDSKSNVSDVRRMTAILHQWGPVMLAYYQPGNNSESLFDADLHAMLTRSFLAQEAANGLFAFGFMDNTRLAASRASFIFVKDALLRYGIAPSPPAAATSFRTGFESGDPQPTWDDTVEWSANVAGFCCQATHMQSSVRSEGIAHSGSAALMYSGLGTSTSESFSYNDIFDLRSRNITIGPTTTLSYWIYPQDGFMGAVGSNGAHVAIDIIFTDGSSLRDSGAVDQYGVRLHPRYQGDGGHLVPSTWNHVISMIGHWVAGKTIDRLLVAYDQSGDAGLFRGYIDDISIQ